MKLWVHFQNNSTIKTERNLKNVSRKNFLGSNIQAFLQLQLTTTKVLKYRSGANTIKNITDS